MNRSHAFRRRPFPRVDRREPVRADALRRLPVRWLSTPFLAVGAGFLLCLAAASARGAPSAAGTGEPPVAMEPVPIESRAGIVGAQFRAGGMAEYRGTLSGTLIHSAPTMTTTWFLYPGACQDRQNGPPGTIGTWAAKTAIVADSLDTYDPATQNHAYGVLDNSLKERLWHITDGFDSPDIGAGLVIAGSRSLWCGKYDFNWVVKSGYPNSTYQILYVDTDVIALAGGSPRSGAYTLSWQENVSTEFNYDYLYLIGGGDGALDRDPIGNSRARLDRIVTSGFDGNAEKLIIQTGSQVTSQSLSYVSHGQQIDGAGSGQPTTTTWSLSGIPAEHRGIYFLFTSDRVHSAEDGLWPEGHGARLDNISASDQGAAPNLYAEQTTAGGTDPSDGDILVSVAGQYAISARVAPGVGTVWTIQAGNNLPSNDYCSPQKQRTVDKMFLGADATSKLTLASEYASVVTCSFPVPAGTASVLATWGEYLNLPPGSGYVAYAEYRTYRGGNWGNWENTSAAGDVHTGAIRAWGVNGDELAAAAGADSVQLRFTVECVPALAADRVNCQPVEYGVLYDNLGLQIVTGVPAPHFGILPAALAQTTFVDGTDALSAGCSAGTITAGRCWPGVRGSDQPATSGPIHDNFNSPLGDSLTVGLGTGIRAYGMGINWKYGFDKSVGAGKFISRFNATSYTTAYDTPRWIYRIFDPATKTWSPWDSSALDADAVSISGSDTTIIDSRLRFNWPPTDKYYVNSGDPADIGLNANVSLPGGWTLNGNSAYGQVPFLPRGSRVQYYFKGVDIFGGVSYQFGSDNLAWETANLPTLPGSSVKAPDIVEFDVLPGVYAEGSGGTLLSGRTDTPVLEIDAAYGTHGSHGDPIAQSARALGVRVDRYRLLDGYGTGGGVGGHELPGIAPLRLGNYFPNETEYGIKNLLAERYKIFLLSSDLKTMGAVEEQDARLLREVLWTPTGEIGGERGIFASGNWLHNSLLSPPVPNTERLSFARDVLGVNSASRYGFASVGGARLTVDDRFSGATGVPGLTPPGTFTWLGRLTCGAGESIDALSTTSTGRGAMFLSAPSNDYLGVYSSRLLDPPSDYRLKTLSMGSSTYQIAKVGFSDDAFMYSALAIGARILMEFIISLKMRRGPFQPDTCFPCPAPVNFYTNWATEPGFQPSTYGLLYPMQDFTMATGIAETTAPPVASSLQGNAPNPFNPVTRIRFTSSTIGAVLVRIFDVAGREVASLSTRVRAPGPGEVLWDGRSRDGRGLASGVYFYRVRFPDGVESARKMTMLK